MNSISCYLGAYPREAITDSILVVVEAVFASTLVVSLGYSLSLSKS